MACSTAKKRRFLRSSARRLPVINLTDLDGSAENGKAPTSGQAGFSRGTQAMHPSIHPHSSSSSSSGGGGGIFIHQSFSDEAANYRSRLAVSADFQVLSSVNLRFVLAVQTLHGYDRSQCIE